LIVTIPTCGESPYLGRLLESCATAGVPAIVVINNTNAEQYQSLVATANDHMAQSVDLGNDINLYAAWNKCIDLTSRDGVGAILNDDIYVHPDSFARIEKSVRTTEGVVGWDAWGPVSENPSSHLRRVNGTYRTHGLAGFAFAFPTTTAPRFDEKYTWWYGDDDWVARCGRSGLPLYVESLCGVHHHTSTTQQARPWVTENVGQDKELFESTWGIG